MIAVSLPSLGVEKESDGNGSNKEVRTLSNFWWDNIILTVITLLLAITFAQSITSYFSSGINCLVTENHTNSVRVYINDLCSQELPNYAKYFPLALYAEVALMSGLQVFWRAACNGRIECFKTSVNTMSLKRSPKTGQYESSDIDTVRYLGGKLHSVSLTLTYILLKLGLQTFVASVGISLAFIEQLEHNTTTTFECESSSFSNSSQWPLTSSEIVCVYRELSTLQYLPWINLGASIIIILSVITGLILLLLHLCKRDYKMIASYMLSTGLKKHKYRRVYLCNCNLPCSKAGVSMDLAFLISKLYGTNYKLGEAVFNLLIYCHLEYLTQEAHYDSTLSPREDTFKLAVKIKDAINRVWPPKVNDAGIHIKPCGILVTNSIDNLAYLIAKDNFFENLICINFNPDITDAGAGIIETSHDYEMFPRVLQIPARFWQRNKQFLVQENTSNGDDTLDNHNFVMLQKVQQDIMNAATSCVSKNGGPLVFIFAPQSEEYHTLYSARHRVARLMKYIHSNEMQQQLQRDNIETYAINVKPIQHANFDIQCWNCIQRCQHNRLDCGIPPWLSKNQWTQVLPETDEQITKCCNPAEYQSKIDYIWFEITVLKYNIIPETQEDHNYDESGVIAMID